MYWNLAHSIFRICQSRFWYEKWFLLNIYHLLDPNWSPNWICSGFIEIWHIWYFEYPDLDTDGKNEKCLEFIEMWQKSKFDKNIW